MIKLSSKIKLATSDVKLLIVFVIISLCIYFTFRETKPPYKEYNHIHIIGQSLALGTGSNRALSTSQPFHNLMLNRDRLVPLVEKSQESPGTSIANTITQLSGIDKILITNSAEVGASYQDLSLGSRLFNDAREKIQKVNKISFETGYKANPTAIVLIHGETDHVNNTGKEYKEYILNLQQIYSEAMGRNSTKLFIDQLSSFTKYRSSVSVIPQMQLESYEENQDKIVLVTPKYFLKYSDGVHLTSESYKLLGEYYGKVINSTVFQKQTWSPLRPINILSQNNEIIIKYYVPSPPIVLDTSLVSLRKNYGFVYSDDKNSAKISKVEILDSDLVKITLNTTPTGNNRKIGYATTGVPGAFAGASNLEAIGGNIRDSDTTQSFSRVPLYNWSVQFEKELGDYN